MVRLKVLNLYERTMIYTSISIPYGAIKSIKRIFLNCKIFLISIPYGAIKSLLHSAPLLAFRQFQFLMVRLKVFSLGE